MKASLFVSDKGVKILFLDEFCVIDSKAFFDLHDIPFNGELENRIKLSLSELDGEPDALIGIVKPDVVLTSLTREKLDLASKEVRVGRVTLQELDGHSFFLFTEVKTELSYGQFLFIDQLRSLKAKLNID